MTPKGRIYCLLHPESKAMEEYIQEALEAGYIWPSTSPMAASFFFVEKRTEDCNYGIDYRGVNELRYPYPLPFVPADLEQLHEARYFTKLDLCRTYNLVRIQEGDK